MLQRRQDPRLLDICETHDILVLSRVVEANMCLGVEWQRTLKGFNTGRLNACGALDTVNTTAEGSKLAVWCGTRTDSRDRRRSHHASSLWAVLVVGD